VPEGTERGFRIAPSPYNDDGAIGTRWPRALARVWQDLGLALNQRPRWTAE